jgi:hypothetical protein
MPQDLPRLSMRNFMYPYMLQFPDERKSHFDSPDIRHPNELGHEYMADMILRYLLRAMCGASDEEDKGLVPHPMHEYEPEVDVWDGKAGYNPQSVKEADKPWLPYPGLAGSELKYSWDPFTLPSLRLDQNWIMDPRPHPEGTSFCQTVDLISPDGLPAMRPSANQGWEHFENRGKHYWKATQPGSIITFDNIEVNAGIVAIFHLRCDQNYGNAKCWVDNMKDRAVEIVSIWDFVCISALHVIAEGVSPGEHSVTCEVVEQTADKNDKHDFAIAAIISH